MDNDDTELVSTLVLEERYREATARLRIIKNTLREAGAVENGFDDAYYLHTKTARNTFRDDLFHCHQIFRDEKSYDKLIRNSFSFDPPDRFRYEWKLSRLGLEKTQILFCQFDRHQCGTWRYRDFVDYMGALETLSGPRPDMHIYTENEEVWRMYMSDNFELDENHHLTLQGFRYYREAIEDTYPLINDLSLFHISTYWCGFVQHQRVNELFEMYADEDHTVSLKRLPLLASECGIFATYQEILHRLQHQRNLHQCLHSILSQGRAVRLFGYCQKSALQCTEEKLTPDSRVCKPGFLRFALSLWHPPVRTYWRSLLLCTRLQMYTRLRRSRQLISRIFGYIRKVSKTGLLRKSCLQSASPVQELGDYVFQFEVGPPFNSNATIQITYNSDADSAGTLHELKYLERGAKCFIFFDFPCKKGTRDNDLQLLSVRLTWFIKTYFGDHIELLPHFFKWFITIPSKLQRHPTGGINISLHNDSTPLIRLVILFTGKMDLYEVMQHLRLPSSMQFDHLLQRFSARWLFSHSLEDILTNKQLVFGHEWSCRGGVDVRFNRMAIGQILKQCAFCIQEEKTEKVEVDARARREYEARQQQEQQHKGNTNHQAAETAKEQMPQRNDEEDTSMNYMQQWLHRLGMFVHTSREVSWMCIFPDLLDILHSHHWMASVLSTNFFQYLDQILSTRGGLASIWSQLSDSFRDEFNQIPVSSFRQRSDQDSKYIENENALLELYDACCKHFTGLHLIRAESGTSGVTCTLEGFNVFSILPHLRR